MLVLHEAPGTIQSEEGILFANQTRVYIYMKLKDPEEFKNETERVDNLFKVSEIGQSVFVPKVGEGVLASAEER